MGYYGDLIRQFKMLRKSQGLILDDIALNSGVDRGTISRMETGKHSPSLSTFIDAAKGIGQMVVLVPIPEEAIEIVRRPIPEKKKKGVDYDHWNYEDED